MRNAVSDVPIEGPQVSVSSYVQVLKAKIAEKDQKLKAAEELEIVLQATLLDYSQTIADLQQELEASKASDKEPPSEE